MRTTVARMLLLAVVSTFAREAIAEKVSRSRLSKGFKQEMKHETNETKHETPEMGGDPYGLSKRFPPQTREKGAVLETHAIDSDISIEVKRVLSLYMTKQNGKRRMLRPTAKDKLGVVMKHLGVDEISAGATARDWASWILSDDASAQKRLDSDDTIPAVARAAIQLVIDQKRAVLAAE